MADKIKGKSATDDLLKEVRDRLAQCVKHEADNRREASEDFRFIAGEQWPDDMRRMRQVESRPCLTINKLPAFVHQVINDQRMNRPSIKVHPVDSGADVEVAEIEQGMIRYIEYNSNADYCYDTAVSHATIGGFGFFRLCTDYTEDDSFDQEIRFKRVQNPFSVYLDPFSQEPDGSDMMWCIVTDLMNKEEFEKQYPKAQAQNASSLTVGNGDTSTVWISDDSIRVAEYYRVKLDPDTLCRLNTGQTMFKSELPDPLPDGVLVEKERASDKRTVQWFKVTGADLLEQTDIPCKYVPVFPVYGDEQIVDGRIRRNGMVRFARDPQRMYNFWMTSATEEVSLRPKTPFIGAVGQFDTGKKEWRQANVRSYPFLEYDPIEVNGSLAPAPQRQQMADVPSGVLAMAMHASDNIKATTGIFDASLGAQGNETSGRAITARQREGDTANFHFADNLARTIRHAGRCILQMIPLVYDTPRVVRVLGNDEKMDTAQVNQPMTQPEMDDQGAIKTVLNDLSVGRYDVTIGVGPSYSTKRAEAVDAMLQLGQSFPQIWQIAGDKMIRAMDWPDADEIADRVAKTIPPELQDKEDEPQGPQQLPPQVQQALQQAGTEIQQLQQALQESQSGMDAKKLDAQLKMQLAESDQQMKLALAQLGQQAEDARIQSQERIAAMNNESKHEIAELQGMIQMLVQKMTPPPGLAADVNADFDTPPKRNGTKKKISIKAPSGKVYVGTIGDDTSEESTSEVA